MELDKYSTLKQLHKDCLRCTNCPLRKDATQVVPGEGNPHADIMFIGEGPGANEDRLGRPFVGAAGKFLDELLESIELARKDVFIANMVKCRPPKNRDPSTSEKEACKPWLDEQIRLIQPQVFVPLGRHALHKFIPDIQISRAHGRFFRADSGDFDGAIVFAMYHPAAALYNGGLRSTLLADMQNLKRFLIKIKEDNIDVEEIKLKGDFETGPQIRSDASGEVSQKVKQVRKILQSKKEQKENEKNSQVGMFS